MKKKITLLKSYYYKNLISILLIGLMHSPVFSQMKKSIEDSYVSYFDLPRESMFIHSNKTTFLAGENIWFKAYVFDKLNKKPSTETKNVYVGLYDSIGNQISKKLFLATKGSSAGNFEIDSTFQPGTYYLKATTKWMKNFKEDDSYIQKIQVINPLKTDKKKSQIYSKEYDIQFLPEGGHIVENIRNSIGVKVINEKGQGSIATGVIHNSKGDQVANFSTNLLGIGKLSFTPLPGEKYVAKVILKNSKEVEIPIHEIKQKGIGISVDNFRRDKTIVVLSTNEKTFNEISGKNYTLLIHQNGAYSSIPFRFSKKTQSISISKQKLSHGVNTITLFDGNKPIVERMFFHQKDPSNQEFLISQFKKEGDSIQYRVSTKLIEQELIDFSISVLPKQTKSYNPKHNITSAFFLRPYLKGEIEQPQYYFNKSGDRKRAYDLDNLLITQGWSRYNWDNIFYNVPKLRYTFEKGITIKGRLNNDLEKVSSLFLFPTKNHKGGFIDVMEKGNFVLKNYFPEKDEVFKFSYSNDKNKIKKPNIVLSFVNTVSPDKINVVKNSECVSYYNQTNSIPKKFITSGVEELDEIVLQAKIEKQKRKEYQLPFRGKLANMNKEVVVKFPSLHDFLNQNGFTSIRNPNGTYTIKANRKMASKVVFFLDNIRVDDYNQFASRSLFDFEDVYMDTSPLINNFGISLRIDDGFGFASVVKLYTRKTSLFRTNYSKSFQSFTKAYFGFESEKKFYNPKYISYQIDSFKDFGVIHWEPNATINNGKSFLFKTINTNLEEVSFYIEGIDMDGKLYSQIVNIKK